MAALVLTCSSLSILHLVYGSQTALLYSNFGLTKVLYAVCLMSGVQLSRFLLRYSSVLLGLFKMLSLGLLKLQLWLRYQDERVDVRRLFCKMYVHWGWGPGSPDNHTFSTLISICHLTSHCPRTSKSN